MELDEPRVGGHDHLSRDISEPASFVRERNATRAEDPELSMTWEAPFKWGMIYLVALVSIEQKARCAEALKTYGLTPPQFAVLSNIGLLEGVTAAKLARMFRVRRQTIAEVIASLSSRSLISVSAAPGRRDRQLQLTALGRDRRDQANRAIIAVEQQMFETLPDAKLDALREALVAVHRHLGIGAE